MIDPLRWMMRQSIFAVVVGAVLVIGLAAAKSLDLCLEFSANPRACLANDTCGLCSFVDNANNTVHLCLTGNGSGFLDYEGCCDSWTHYNSSGIDDTTNRFKKCDPLCEPPVACEVARNACQTTDKCEEAWDCISYKCNSPNSCNGLELLSCLLVANFSGDGEISVLNDLLSCYDAHNASFCKPDHSGANNSTSTTSIPPIISQCHPTQCTDLLVSCQSSPACVAAWDCVGSEFFVAGSCNSSCLSTCSSQAFLDEEQNQTLMTLYQCYQLNFNPFCEIGSPSANGTDTACSPIECKRAQLGCSSDGTCNQALMCAANAARTFGDCDTTCVATCAAPLGLNAAQLQALADAVECYRQRCILADRPGPDCIPSYCLNATSSCHAVPGCMEAYECVRAISFLSGTCNSQCLMACQPLTVSDVAIKAYIDAAGCFLGNFAASCTNRTFSLPEPSDVCAGRCGSLFASCATSGSCLAALKCITSVPNCNISCLNSCVNMTSEGSLERNVLVQSLVCQETCVTGAACALYTTSDRCIFANQIGATCYWNSECVPLIDKCSVLSASIAVCSVNPFCRWDSFSGTCYQFDNECRKIADAQVCVKTPLCLVVQRCAPNNCKLTCSDELAACLADNGCREKFACTERSEGLQQCLSLSISRNSSALLDALLYCELQCQSSSSPTPNPLLTTSNAINTVTSPVTETFPKPTTATVNSRTTTIPFTTTITSGTIPTATSENTNITTVTNTATTATSTAASTQVLPSDIPSWIPRSTSSPSTTGIAQTSGSGMTSNFPTSGASMKTPSLSQSTRSPTIKTSSSTGITKATVSTTPVSMTTTITATMTATTTTITTTTAAATLTFSSFHTSSTATFIKTPFPIGGPGIPNPLNTTSLPQCTVEACTNQLVSCLNDSSCKVAFELIAYSRPRYQFCGHECTKTIAAQLSLSPASEAKLVELVQCHTTNCFTFSAMCSDVVLACMEDLECLEVLQDAGMSLNSSNCSVSVLDQAFGIIPERSPSRTLLTAVFECCRDVSAPLLCDVERTTKSCISNIGEKATQFAHCEWQSECRMSVDPCFNFTVEALCETQENCSWIGLHCISSVDECSNYIGETCLGASGCRQTADCIPNIACDSACGTSTSTCFQFDDCVAAWKCFQSTTARSMDDAYVCSRTISQISTYISFQDYVSCFTDCERREACNIRCSAVSFSCTRSASCQKALDCFIAANILGDCDAECIENCTSLFANSTEERVLLWPALQCQLRCSQERYCFKADTEYDCHLRLGCIWSERCAFLLSKNCARFLTESDCLAPSEYCTWEDFTSSCVARGDDSNTTIGSLNGSFPNIDDTSLVLMHQPDICRHVHDLECRPNDRCDRLCNEPAGSCYFRPNCWSALTCLQTCAQRDNNNCYDQCLPYISSDSLESQLFDDYLICRGNCTFDVCTNCTEIRSVCNRNRECHMALRCLTQRLALSRCGASCFSNCSALATSHDTKALFLATSSCLFRCLDPYFTVHPSCTGVNYSHELSTELRAYMCTNINFLSTVNLTCTWNETSNQCVDPVLTNSTWDASICDAIPDICLDCCSRQLTTCPSQRVLSCLENYTTCATQCETLLHQPPFQKDTAIFIQLQTQFSLPTTADAIDILSKLSLVDLRFAIWSTINAPGLNQLDVFITGLDVSQSEDATNPTVLTVNYVIIADASNAVPIVMRAQSALQSGGFASQVASMGLGLHTSSQCIRNIMQSWSEPDIHLSSAQSFETNDIESEQSHVVVTPLGHIPAGAYFTAEQIADLKLEVIRALSLPFDADVHVTIENGMVLAIRTSLLTISDDDLACEGNLLIEMDYTLVNGTAVHSYTVTKVSTATLTSQTNDEQSKDSSSSAATTIVVVTSVCATLVVVIIVSLLLRRRHHRLRVGEMMEHDDIFAPSKVATDHTALVSRRVASNVGSAPGISHSSTEEHPFAVPVDLA